jgi:hypothetical protein
MWIWRSWPAVLLGLPVPILANLLNEAAILAARRNLTEISMDEINDAVDRVLAGPEKKRATPPQRRGVAELLASDYASPFRSRLADERPANLPVASMMKEHCYDQKYPYNHR